MKTFLRILLCFFLVPFFSPLPDAAAQFDPPSIGRFAVMSVNGEGMYLFSITGPGPFDIASVSVDGPSGIVEFGPDELLMRLSQNTRTFDYLIQTTAASVTGTHTITVEDALGRTDEASADFTFRDDVPAPPMESLSPQDEAYAGGTTPTLSFSPVTGDYRYIIHARAFNDPLTIVWNSDFLLEPSVKIPAGILWEGDAYDWYAAVTDASDADNPSGNYRLSGPYRFYAGSKGTPLVGSAGAAVIDRPSLPDLFLYGFRVENVAPWDLVSLTAVQPGGQETVYDTFTTSIQIFEPQITYAFPSGLADGTHDLLLEDDEGRSEAFSLEYSKGEAPAVDESLRTPADKSYVSTLTPLLQWTPPAEGLYYRVMVYKYKSSTIIYEGRFSNETSASVPENLLVNHASYQWEVHVCPSLDPLGLMVYSKRAAFTVNLNPTLPDNGIWKSDDGSLNFYLQKYEAGSAIVVVKDTGGTYTVFLDPDYFDGIDQAQDFDQGGYSLSLNFTDTSHGTLSGTLPGGSVSNIPVSLAFADTHAPEGPVNGIWKSDDGLLNFYLQKYEAGSVILVVKYQGGGYAVFLDGDYPDGVSAEDDFDGRGYNMTLSLTDQSQGLFSASLPGGELSSTAVSRWFGDIR